jgi:hypothetical protein
MMTPIIGGLIEAGLKIIEKVIPDPQAKAQAQLELMKLTQAGEFKQLEADLQIALAQAEINKAEALSSDPFRAGWRPFIGWVCGLGFATQFVIAPWGTWITALRGVAVPFPELDMTTMMPLLFAMLGLGAYRTYEKVQGASK